MSNTNTPIDPAEAAIAAEFTGYLRHLSEQFAGPLEDRIRRQETALEERMKRQESALVQRTDAAAQRMLEAGVESERLARSAIVQLETRAGQIGDALTRQDDRIDKMLNTVEAQTITLRRLRWMVVASVSVSVILLLTRLISG